MALITSPVPQIGATNASEQVDTTNLLQAIKTLLNGGLELDNLSTLLGQIANPPVVSALPGSPVTGQRVRYRPAPGVLWPLRYNADATGSHKWEADGVEAWTVGPQIGTGVTGGVGGAYSGIATYQINVPISGTYTVDAGAVSDNDAVVALVVQVGGVFAPTDDYVMARAGAVGKRTYVDLELAAGTVLYFAHRSASGGSFSSRSYSLSLTPRAVG